MALAWNAGWVNALRGSNPLSSAREVPDQLSGRGLFLCPHNCRITRTHTFTSAYCRHMPSSKLHRLGAFGAGLALSALIDVAVKRSVTRHRTTAYAAGLSTAAIVYPAARAGRRTEPDIAAREWAAVAASAAFLGSALALPPTTARFVVAAGWAAHPLFDILHERGTTSRLPDCYPAMCAGYDVGVAALLATCPK